MAFGRRLRLGFGVDEGLGWLVFLFLMTVSLAEWDVEGNEWSESERGVVPMIGAEVVVMVVVVPLVNIPEEVVVVVVVVVAGVSIDES